MALGTSPRAWFDAVSWHLRGVFATEANRRVGFAARALWQPAEIEARRGLARELAAELSPDLRVDAADGHRVLSKAAMPDLSQVCDIGHSIVTSSSLADGEANTAKKFSRYRLASTEERLALLRVGLDQRVIAMASAYLGVLPVITEADFFCSFAVDGPFTKSQLWHCDDDAGDVFKLFVYCDDVVDADGPFELIEPAASKRVRDAIGYRYAGRRYRVADEVMERFVPAPQVVKLIGPRGTAFVVDTVRCFHRGSRIRDKAHRRVAGMVCYAPPSGRTLPLRLAGGKAPLASFADSFSGKLERAVLGMPTATKWI